MFDGHVVQPPTALRAGRVFYEVTVCDDKSFEPIADWLTDAWRVWPVGIRGPDLPAAPAAAAQVCLLSWLLLSASGLRAACLSSDHSRLCCQW